MSFIASGALFFATLSPIRAFAEWEDVGRSLYVCVTNVNNSSFGSGTIKVQPISGSYSGVNALVATTTTRQYGTLSGLSSTTVTYLVAPVSGGNIPAGKKFRINTEEFLPFWLCWSSPTSSTSQTYYMSPVNLRYWVRSTNGTVTSVNPESDGLFRANVNVSHVIVSYTASNMNSGNGWDSCNCGGVFYVQVPDGEPTVEGYIQDQTQELKSTDGSSGIVSGMANQGQSISQNLNFVQQTGQFITSAFDAVANGEQSQGLHFPGLVIQEHTILQAQDVAFLGYLGTELEGTIRNFVTMVLFLAWIMGLRGIYRKIFLGETEVEVVDDE